MTTYIRWFRDIGLADVGLVGGKTASLGELFGQLGAAGVRVPDGFAVTAKAWKLTVGARGEPVRTEISGDAQLTPSLTDAEALELGRFALAIVNPDAVVRGLEAVAAAEAGAGTEDVA